MKQLNIKFKTLGIRYVLKYGNLDQVLKLAIAVPWETPNEGNK